MFKYKNTFLNYGQLLQAIAQVGLVVHIKFSPARKVTTDNGSSMYGGDAGNGAHLNEISFTAK